MTASLTTFAAELSAQTIQYLLRPTSQIRQRDGGRSEELHGTFDLTVMPIPDAYTIEAVTGIHWYSDSFRVAGAGFVERLGRNHTSMVVDVMVNNQSILLTSIMHATEGDGSFHIHLTSPPDAAVAIEVELIAFANATDAPDADGDGIPDGMDLCPTHPDLRQDDDDLDGVGDACDACPGSAIGAAVLSNGCSLEQNCPCGGPEPGTLWPDQQAFVICVARTLKTLAIAEEITRSQARQLVQAAVRSGCGMPVVALARWRSTNPEAARVSRGTETPSSCALGAGSSSRAPYFFWALLPPYPDVDSTADLVALLR